MTPIETQTAETPRGARRRAEILAAARSTFSEKGYDRASMAEIATQVGVVEGAIYKHFASKRELLFECIRQFYEPLIESTRREVAGIRGTRNRLRFLIWKSLRGFVEEPGICRLIIEEIRPRGDYFESVIHELNREHTSHVLAVIQEGIDRGELRPDTVPATIRDLVYGGIEHLAWKALSGRGGLDAEAKADELTAFVWRGAQAQTAALEEARPDAVLQLEGQVARLERIADRLEPTA